MKQSTYGLTHLTADVVRVDSCVVPASQLSGSENYLGSMPQKGFMS